VADEAAGDGEEGFVDVGAAFVAQAQAAVLVEPGDGAFDDPALSAEAGAVRAVLAGDQCFDPERSQFVEDTVVVVAAVTEDALGSALGRSGLAAHGWDRTDEVEQLACVWPVGGGQDRGERNPVRVADQVVLAAGFAPVDRARTGFEAPFSAGRNDESTTARDQSILSASRNLASIVSCSRCQTPCCCHSRSRRQQVIPDPQPSSCGRCSQPIPVLSTNTIPVKTRRSSIRLRPG